MVYRAAPAGPGPGRAHRPPNGAKHASKTYSEYLTRGPADVLGSPRSPGSRLGAGFTPARRVQNKSQSGPGEAPKGNSMGLQSPSTQRGPEASNKRRSATNAPPRSSQGAPNARRDATEQKLTRNRLRCSILHLEHRWPSFKMRSARGAGGRAELARPWRCAQVQRAGTRAPVGPVRRSGSGGIAPSSFVQPFRVGLRVPRWRSHSKLPGRGRGSTFGAASASWLHLASPSHRILYGEHVVEKRSYTTKPSGQPTTSQVIR